MQGVFGTVYLFNPAYTTVYTGVILLLRDITSRIHQVIDMVLHVYALSPRVNGYLYLVEPVWYTRLMSDTKLCNKCNETKVLSMFPGNRCSPDGKYSMCKICKRIRKNEWRKGRRRALHLLIDKLKSIPCADCKNEYPPCAMDFHHIDISTKKETIALMIQQALPISSVLDEIKKCIVLCAVCHRIRTHTKFPYV